MAEAPALLKIPALLRPLASVAACAYGRGVSWRNARFDRGIGVGAIEVRGARVPVLSVGNLTVGGTGKSPFVAWLCHELVQLLRQPVIGMRGYKSRVGASGAAQSDEALEYALTASAALVVANPRRRAALNAELSREIHAPWVHRAVVVLDDGFQHRSVARELDIVLVDATRPGLDGALIPRGILREPASNLSRADLVVITKAHDPAQRRSAEELVLAARGSAADAACVHEWAGLTVYENSAPPEELPMEWLSGRALVTASGLGNPAHFEQMAQRAGARLLHTARVGDHQPWSARELDALCATAARAGTRPEALLVSRKDFVKLDALPQSCPIVVPHLAVRFLEGEACVRERVSRALSITGALGRPSAS